MVAGFEAVDSTMMPEVVMGLVLLELREPEARPFRRRICRCPIAGRGLRSPNFPPDLHGRAHLFEGQAFLGPVPVAAAAAVAVAQLRLRWRAEVLGQPQRGLSCRCRLVVGFSNRDDDRGVGVTVDQCFPRSRQPLGCLLASGEPGPPTLCPFPECLFGSVLRASKPPGMGRYRAWRSLLGRRLCGRIRVRRSGGHQEPESLASDDSTFVWVGGVGLQLVAG